MNDFFFCHCEWEKIKGSISKLFIAIEYLSFYLRAQPANEINGHQVAVATGSNKRGSFYTETEARHRDFAVSSVKFLHFPLFCKGMAGHIISFKVFKVLP